MSASAVMQEGRGAQRSVVVLNGPNLNLLGQREPKVYGYDTLADVEALCRREANDAGLSLTFSQTNAEHEMIDAIHAARGGAGAIIINPAAWSHTSVAILDALSAYEGLVLEVHISNIHKREAFRHHSYVSHRADGVICGFGVQGYALAVQRCATLLKDRTDG